LISTSEGQVSIPARFIYARNFVPAGNWVSGDSLHAQGYQKKPDSIKNDYVIF
jgi:hypothetical protein